jgi:hypothetical protein
VVTNGRGSAANDGDRNFLGKVTVERPDEGDELSPIESRQRSATF